MSDSRMSGDLVMDCYGRFDACYSSIGHSVWESTISTMVWRRVDVDAQVSIMRMIDDSIKIGVLLSVHRCMVQIKKDHS